MQTILPSTYSMLYIQVLVACKPILPRTYMCACTSEVDQLQTHCSLYLCIVKASAKPSFSKHTHIPNTNSLFKHNRSHSRQGQNIILILTPILSTRSTTHSNWPHLCGHVCTSKRQLVDLNGVLMHRDCSYLPACDVCGETRMYAGKCGAGNTQIQTTYRHHITAHGTVHLFVLKQTVVLE